MPELVKHYGVIDEHLSVISECPVTFGHIHRFLKSFEMESIADAKRAVRLAIFRSPGNRVAMCCPEVGMAEVEPVHREAWFRFRRLFAHLVINCGEEYFVLHASGVVGRDRTAALIVGESNAGKTTLLAALLRKGYRFLCDDYAPIRYDDMSVISMPTGATLGERSFQFLPELSGLQHRACRFFIERQWQWTVNFGEMYPAVPANSRVRVAHIFFMRSDFGQSSRIAPCHPYESSIRFIEARLQGPRNIDIHKRRATKNVAERRLALAQELTNKAKAFALVNGDLAQTTDLIASVVGPP